MQNILLIVLSPDILVPDEPCHRSADLAEAVALAGGDGDGATGIDKAGDVVVALVAIVLLVDGGSTG